MSQFDEGLTTETHCLPIVDSYDPNDKSVSPEGITANKYVKPNTLLDYTIRFQNTGTAVAYKVVVVDTLDINLDIASLQWGSASHNYEIDVTGEGRPVLIFTFNNINLPDSTSDELNSHGFLKFKIAPLDSVTDNTIIHNSADIYFDFNAPIKTNDAWVNIYDTTLIGNPISIINCDTTVAPIMIIQWTDTTVCKDEILSNSLTDGNSYYWNTSNGEIFFESNQTLPTYNSSSIYVAVGDSNSCFIDSDSVYISVYDTIPQAEFSYQLTNFEISLIDSSSNDVNSWSWSIGNDTISAFDTSSHLFTQDGTYEVCLIAFNDCFNDTLCKEVTINGVGVNEVQSNSIVSIYPNPVTNQLTIELKDSEKRITSVQLIDVRGRVINVDIASNSARNEVITIDVSTLDNGLYIYEVLSGNEILGVGEIIKK